jgi:hypothetical protein
MSRFKYVAGCIVVVASLFSCKKTVRYDVKGDPIAKFYFNNLASGNAPQNSLNYAVVNIPDAAGSGLLNLSTTLPTAVKFPVMSTKPVSENVMVTATVDNSLIDQYNAANNTNYLPFPTGVLTADILSVNILKGETKSVDSISILSNAANLHTLTGKAYMAPIRLTTVSNPGAGEIAANAETKIAYVVVNVEQRQIRFNGTASQALGSLISPRTGWLVQFTPAPTLTSGGGSIIDGSTSSYSRFGTSPVQVDVNLQTVTNVTGIRLYTSNNTTHTPTQVEVYLSSDGINYTLTGLPLRANLTYASSYNYILFYKSISAQYIRLRLLYTTSTNTQNTRVTELDVYAN